MKERPILFSGPMVRALLDGSKTQTRRVCKPAQFYSLSAVVEVPDPLERGQVYNGSHFGDEDGEVQFACPYGGRGDRLWVRETWAPNGPNPSEGALYRADFPEGPLSIKFKPSIHMPRWASRITLEVVSVRVERLQAISEADAMAEGSRSWAQEQDTPVKDIPAGETRLIFRQLWEQINGSDSWDANPWVWAVEFRRLP